MTDIDTTNDFGFGVNGYKKIVTQSRYIEIKDKQQAYRTAAWILFLSEMLPDDGTNISYEEVKAAILCT